MCIRDSARTVEFLAPIAGTVWGRTGFDLSAPVDEVPASDCLLYTSDAADERSSVDLGGRRIIKKKKRSQSNDETTYRMKNDAYREQVQVRQGS